MAQRIYLVTGSSRGIGLGLVRELVSRGHRVVATCRNPDSASELEKLLTDNGQPKPVACDVTSDESVDECFKKVCTALHFLSYKNLPSYGSLLTQVELHFNIQLF